MFASGHVACRSRSLPCAVGSQTELSTDSEQCCQTNSFSQVGTPWYGGLSLPVASTQVSLCLLHGAHATFSLSAGWITGFKLKNTNKQERNGCSNALRFTESEFVQVFHLFLVYMTTHLMFFLCMQIITQCKHFFLAKFTDSAGYKLWWMLWWCFNWILILFCIFQGTFPLVPFLGGICGSTVVLAIVLWITQRRNVKKHTS